MSRLLFAFVGLLVLLVGGPEAGAVCTAGNPNSNIAEATPTSAFVDHGNGTVTHNLTGLMWKQCPQGQSGADCATGSALAMNWSGALAAAKNDATAGYNDWRLPNKKELESLVEYCGYDPAINRSLFPATPSDAFWTSTTIRALSSEPIDAWVVHFNFGYDDGYEKANSTATVRLVRGGASFSGFDIYDSGGPDPFGFTAQTGVSLSALATSNTIVVVGINEVTASIGIVGGSYTINGGGYTTAAGTVANGDSVTVQLTSSSSYNTMTTATLNIGGVVGEFNVTTLTSAVSHIVVDSTTPTTLYAGLEGVGVYKSIDSAANWVAATMQPSNSRVKALVIKPSDHTALFAATYGGGAFKSSNSGATWSACATQPANLNLLSMTVDAAGKLYVGSEAGVYVSLDNCDSWSAMNTGLPL